MSDAMILTVATALGLAVIRYWAVPGIFGGMTSVGKAVDILGPIVASVALYWAPAVLLLRCKKPRPS